MVNSVVLVGTVEKSDERRFSNGDAVVNLRVKTVDRWTSKAGEQKEFSSYHNVVVKGDRLTATARGLPVGAIAGFTGKLQTRSYEGRSGKAYVTEVIVGPFNGDVITFGEQEAGQEPEQPAFDDEIPF